MKRYVLTGLLISSLVVLGACASKKKVEDSASGGIAASDNAGAVDSKAMNFDASGSDSGKISGLNTIFFEYDKADITAESRKMLGDNITWIKGNPKVTIQIEGHCDQRGSIEYNLALGERRAKAVKNYLTGMGVDAKRLTIISYGEEKPLDSADTEAAMAKNRRANFVPLPQ